MAVKEKDFAYFPQTQNHKTTAGTVDTGMFKDTGAFLVSRPEKQLQGDVL